jgi:purine-nucleoside/S-methyl-5'-thioadenosine phosphorylase / adenosine deaminase
MAVHPEPIPPPPAEAFVWDRQSWGWLLTCRPIAAAAVHGFTTRQLAIAGGTGRNDAAWHALAATAGVARDSLAAAIQVHGASVIRAYSYESGERPRADGLASDDPAVALTVRVADCVPLLVIDARRGVAAAVHAGWRGTAAGIAGAAISLLARSFGCAPGDLAAALGPSIGACCYRVGPELTDAFRAGGHGCAVDRWFRSGHKRLHLDLWAANRDQLVAAGVPDSSVFVSGLCTACHPEWFYSYRREGAAAGRLVGFIRPSGAGRRA